MEYNQLKASIAAVIKTNNRKEITGQLLQNVLFQMTNVIGENLQLAGFATPLTDPHEPDQNLFYITDQGGVYPHFDNLTVDDGLTFLMWKNGEWTSHTVGVVTQEWVDSHYVSIDFFRSLFRAYDSAGLEILPNNNPEEALPTVVDNIKAMVGFWTEQYISALGQQTGGGGGGGATSLDELSDVFLTNPSLGQALVFTITPDHPEGIWVNQTIQAGTDMATVWAALAGNTTQQINISHLTDALADYATKTYVDQNFITVAYFDRLFRAYNGSTLLSHNDVTSTIDNIKAMFGFWTEQYLSALGNNSGGGGQLLALSNMADVTLTTPIADKQVLTFDAVSGKWINGNGGASSLATLTDVTLTSLQNGQTLFYDSTTSKWYNSALKTINGQSLLGSGDISVGGGAQGNYLPLTGGTLSNVMPNNSGILNIYPTGLSGQGPFYYSMMLLYSGLPYYNRNAIAFGRTFERQESSIISFYRGANGNNNFLSFGLHSVDDILCVYGSGNVGIGTSTAYPTSKLHVKGQSGDGLPVINIEAMTKNDSFCYALTAMNPYLTGDSYNGIVFGKALSYCNSALLAYHHYGDGNTNNSLEFGFYGTERVLTLYANGSSKFFCPTLPISSGAVNIISNSGSSFSYSIFATSSNLAAGHRNGIILGKKFDQYNCAVITYKHLGDYSTANFIGFGLYSVDDVLTVCANGCVGVKTSSPSYALHVAGTIYATGAITALSDARKKDITGEADVTVEQIAHAPAVQFLWKDKERRKDGQQVGTLAQYWQTVLPEVVSDKGGELSMQYGVAALVSSIIIARKVANHEVRIDKMEKWMKKWAEENDE